MSTSIEWTDRTWNPVTGCTKVSAGCKNCYAETVANRRLPQGGFTDRPFTEVRCHPERLDAPLRWRKPQRIFVNSMSDLFHEDVPDGFIGRVYGVMGAATQHTFQVLTKRPERLASLFPGMNSGFTNVPMSEEDRADLLSLAPPWPLPNVWLGASVENQETADERIPLLLQTPAAVRFVSYEPALGPVDFGRFVGAWRRCPHCAEWWGEHVGTTYCWKCRLRGDEIRGLRESLDWIIVGGESGPGARPFDIAWARSTIAQCKAAGVPVFVKQLGANPTNSAQPDGDLAKAYIRNRKGGDMDEWPEDLRVREFPR